MRKVTVLLLCLSMLLGLAGASLAADKLSVALIIEGQLGDASFYDSASRGFDKAKAELGIVGKVIECNYDPANYVPYMATAAKKFDLVLSVGFGMMDAIAEVAPKFPETDFAQFDTTGDIAHVTFIDFKQSEGSFLAGALAAMMTAREGDPRVNPEATIGVVCGEDIPVMYSFIAGYEQGAKTVNPDIKILRGFVGRWDDPAGGKEMTLNQHKNGADVVYQVAGGTGEGIIAAAKEGGFYAIGVDSPQEHLAPEAVLTSMLKRLDVVVYDLIKAKQEGTYRRGTVLRYGLKEGGVGLSWSDSALKLVPADVKARLDELTEEVASGKIEVAETTK
ncbi:MULTISPECIES: BMP family lipoprotein [Dethiosulfovibrio]|uniref:BMP family ABC transporter substrate-binding protein n=2 Tax=Dethiosulfovibrio TaxID=47054 RepID=A0ABS9ES46_9BACT|nr:MULTISPECIES: BMP family ABC transporter substrate-binding protein [Dethiosulfovibrio]MCF4114530.1 BMP family ABC transporter substrate-binding protein [Dethiosulfovibrio russensis]MCF4143514.1 BMP family ABC transporter substrate-binding protein [Dethiosulfovibrio marinus]MCF4145920.1 BMP family ABC transporter substrate-binding protein [Dethiosulfovibrio acidaminovorans]